MSRRGLRMGPGLVPALLGLAACATAPIPVEQAERACLSAALDARAPRTEVGFGVGSHGVRGGYVKVGMSSDYIMGRDPSEIFNQCVLRRSGQMPTRPLYDQPGWGAR
ncbi:MULTISPECIES: hypothetical protein [Paracoccus]|uniref:Lipoprotein n=1 Tax=Paracoccus kondratievae TaxID=135740 RepID=A0AAD3NUL5_9RHOB|nr:MULTISPECIES: hypothetical protein [Paracoccus]GLK62607.1 hypothetical protein GCM10017635_00750 [Paracoccus kondratievae]SMG12506.1 hypothetical protein SAMN02746000_00581 [Paracoccus sp. J56]